RHRRPGKGRETVSDPSSALLAGPQARADDVEGLRLALNRALRGKPGVVEQVLACLLARGHLLLEDLPGLGKTTLAKAPAGPSGKLPWTTSATPWRRRSS